MLHDLRRLDRRLGRGRRGLLIGRLACGCGRSGGGSRRVSLGSRRLRSRGASGRLVVDGATVRVLVGDDWRLDHQHVVLVDLDADVIATTIRLCLWRVVVVVVVVEQVGVHLVGVDVVGQVDLAIEGLGLGGRAGLELAVALDGEHLAVGGDHELVLAEVADVELDLVELEAAAVRRVLHIAAMRRRRERHRARDWWWRRWGWWRVAEHRT